MSAKLTENDWKANSAKCKIKNVELQKALAAYDKIEDEEHDDALETIAQIKALAADLKKSKEISSNPAAAKYVAEILAAADAEHREISKDKVEAEKAQAKQPKAEDGDADSEGKDSPLGKMLTLAMQQLKSNPDLAYEFIYCDAKPPAVMIAKKITPKHKELLTETTGSKKFLHTGACRFAEGQLVFEPDKPASSLTPKLHECFKHHTGKKHNLRVAKETEDAGAMNGQIAAEPLLNAKNPDAASPLAPPPPGAKSVEDAATKAGAAAGGKPQAAGSGPLGLSGSVGQGGKNSPADVTAVQNALNAKVKAGLTANGKIDSKTIEAIRSFQKAMGMARQDGRVDVGRGTARALAAPGALPPAPPPPKPAALPKLGKAELGKAPDVWHGMRKVVDTNISEVKRAVKAHYAHEHPSLLKEIEQNLAKLDAITDKLDHRIADALAKAHAAKDEAARKAELKSAKTILAEYIGFVKSEPLIAHLDANPWVKIDLRNTLTTTLTHMAQSIGA
jgi:peptidoglycan hydrolase-like protein with peptidoglycan-binding domain